MRPGGRRDLPESLGSLVWALGAVGFIRGRRVHWGAPRGSSCSPDVAGFTGVRFGGLWVYPG